MKRKYFLRGLGMGIVVTASVLTISHRAEEPSLSDREIIERAEALGMVKKEEGSLPNTTVSPDTQEDGQKTEGKENASMSPEPSAGVGNADAVDKNEDPMADDATSAPEDDDKTQPEQTPGASKEPEVTAAPKKTDLPASSSSPEPTVSPKKTKKPEATQKPKATQTPKSTSYVRVRIERGMWSDAVAKAMENVGLVENAEDFDEYLCDNGYSSFISVGTYKIPEGASYSEIAAIITRR